MKTTRTSLNALMDIDQKNDINVSGRILDLAPQLWLEIFQLFHDKFLIMSISKIFDKFL